MPARYLAYSQFERKCISFLLRKSKLVQHKHVLQIKLVDYVTPISKLPPKQTGVIYFKWHNNLLCTCLEPILTFRPAVLTSADGSGRLDRSREFTLHLRRWRRGGGDNGGAAYMAALLSLFFSLRRLTENQMERRLVSRYLRRPHVSAYSLIHTCTCIDRQGRTGVALLI